MVVGLALTMLGIWLYDVHKHNVFAIPCILYIESFAHTLERHLK